MTLLVRSAGTILSISKMNPEKKKEEILAELENERAAALAKVKKANSLWGQVWYWWRYRELNSRIAEMRKG